MGTRFFNGLLVFVFGAAVGALTGHLITQLRARRLAAVVLGRITNHD